jgi:hypothetical protein
MAPSTVRVSAPRRIVRPAYDCVSVSVDGAGEHELLPDAAVLGREGDEARVRGERRIAGPGVARHQRAQHRQRQGEPTCALEEVSTCEQRLSWRAHGVHYSKRR